MEIIIGWCIFEQNKTMNHYLFSVKARSGDYMTIPADDSTYDDLWKDCINNGWKVVGVFNMKEND